MQERELECLIRRICTLHTETQTIELKSAQRGVVW